MYSRCLTIACLVAFSAPVFGDGPKDNIADKVRRIPPPGAQIDDAARRELQSGVDDLGKLIGTLRTSLKDRPQLLELLPDVQIYHKAVEWALLYDEFQEQKDKKHIATALW
jgi:hypothetical protein